MNLKYYAKNLAQPSSTSRLPCSDVLAHVMQMCKESCGTDSVFVRSVEAAPEPMCVLATEQQLADMERFCTGDPCSVLCIDPTFNLGAFYVTPTTYHNLLVETRNGNNPILLGPILIHQTKTFRPFHYLASTLIRMNPRLLNLRAYGTDGEPELMKAFGICFPNAVHLRCTNHLRQNIKGKLRELNVPQSVSKEFLTDIFGTQIGTHFEAGLADAKSEASFSKSLEGVKAKWNNLERSCSPSGAIPQFHSWFCRYKADDFKKCVLPEVRRKAGCKDPACFFTTNSSESLNHLIKLEVEWKESQLPSLIDSLKSITSDQNAELERAVIGHGEWHFTSQYTGVVVSESCWFSQMSDAAKKKHMQKVFSMKPHSGNTSCGAQSCASSNENSAVRVPTADQTSILGIFAEECGVASVAKSTLQNMWTKAERLVKSDGQIIKVPWSSDNKDRLVKSSSSIHPHLVTRDLRGRYCCDKNCPMFKGFSICSHAIATAHVNCELKSFLDVVNGVCRPNLTAIANHGMPSGTGRKGGMAKRTRSRKRPAIETRSVRPCLDADATGLIERSSSSTNLNQTFTPSVSSASVQEFLPNVSRPPFANSTLRVPPGLSVLQNSSSGSDLQSVVLNPGALGYPSRPHGLTVPVVSTSAMSHLQSPCVTTANASSLGQVIVGTTVNVGSPTHASLPPSTPSFPLMSAKKPFILKFKTNLIKVCQACRKNFDGPNDTMGLLVARPERRLVSNLATGAQFLGKESNSHYHLHMMCLKAADAFFKGEDIVISDDVKVRLNRFQRIYLTTCFHAPL